MVFVDPSDEAIAGIPNVNIIRLIAGQSSRVIEGGKEESLPIIISNDAAAGERLDLAATGRITVNSISAGIIKIVGRIETNTAGGR